MDPDPVRPSHSRAPGTRPAGAGPLSISGHPVPVAGEVRDPRDVARKARRRTAPRVRGRRGSSEPVRPDVRLIAPARRSTPSTAARCVGDGRPTGWLAGSRRWAQGRSRPCRSSRRSEERPIPRRVLVDQMLDDAGLRRRTRDAVRFSSMVLQRRSFFSRSLSQGVLAERKPFWPLRESRAAPEVDRRR